MKLRRCSVWVLWATIGGGACGGGSGAPPDGSPPDGGAPDVSAPVDGPADAPGDAETAHDAEPQSCPRPPRPADGPRKAVVSHPYGADGRPAADYELIDVAADGTLTLPGVHLTLRTASQGRIHFTPDGEVALVAQDDGSIGAFQVDSSGSAQVIHEGFRGAFYASSIVMDPAGNQAYVLDSEWRASGGGIYRIAIGCDGTLSDLGLWAPAKLAYGMLLPPGAPDHAAVAASDILDSTAGNNAFLLDRASAPSLLGAAAAFGDDNAIVSDVAATPDGRFFLIADNSEFSGLPNRIAVVGIDATALQSAQILSPIQDPVSIVASPLGDALLVASGYGNALFLIGYHPQAATPFALAGEITYTGGRPQLPGPAVLIDRGALRGRVLVAEVAGLRRVQFRGNGGVDDLGVTSVGSGTAGLIGALGVQP